MTRDEIFDAYAIDGNRVYDPDDVRVLTITSPGKFENEQAWAPYFWEMTMDGTAEEISWPDEAPIYIVELDDEDRKIWPEIPADIMAAVLDESEQGFVGCVLQTAEALADLHDRCDKANEEDENEIEDEIKDEIEGEDEIE